VICANCGTPNEPGRKFCGECGARLSAACPECGTANAPGTKFCGECGTALADQSAVAASADSPQSAPPTSGAAGAERRLVSVLFADLVGSTTLAEDRDPEESRDLLSRYFDLSSDLIGRYGGTIEKFIGDAVMAVWGVPTAHEDDAERAVRAALDLVTAVGGMTDAGQSLQLRAAVLTGEAAATIGASGQGMVAGDLVNTASRLQGAAPPGTVLVGESTYRATSGAIGYEEAGEHLLKGKAAPVAAWRAVRVLGMRGGARRRVALEPPFVGRDEELRLIKDLFHATIRERKPRLVTVVGQAGIGKSRLGWEFEKYIDGVTLTAYWHAGRSPSYGEGISFWALAEMIRERAGIAEADDSDTARTKLAAMAAEWLTDPEERRWVEPRLAGLLGLEEIPSGQREELFAAWRTFFERIADRDAVILVFKDLHWADAALLEFIEHLLAWSKNHPIYVLAMTRPDLFERHPAWGGSGVRNATTLALEPLADDSMRELLHGLVPGLPESAVTTILGRAEGVPLYAVETVRMLIDRGQLVAEGDGYALAGPIERLAVPETLQALVAARIDANTPEDRSLLADASVLGQSFTTAALAGVSGRAEGDLAASLDRLVKRELLIRDDDPRSPERGQHRFVQAVVREIAYETLSKKDRRAKHLASARYFEALGDDEVAGVLASHYLEALRATPAGPEADALAVQARIALRAASDRAAALHSWGVALRHLEDALEIATDPTEQASLHVAAGEAGRQNGRSEAVNHALEAAAIADRLGDTATRNRALGLAGQIYINRSLGTDALEVLEPAAANLGESEPEAAGIFAELARLYMMTDRFDEAVAAAERALRAAAPHRDTEKIAEALITRGSAIANLGRLDEAEAVLRGATAIADHGGHIAAGLRARNNLVSSLLEEAPLSELVPVYDESIETARRYGQSAWLAQHLTSRAVASVAGGNWSGAEADVDEAADLSLGEFHLAAVAALRAQFHALRGDEPPARDALVEAQRWNDMINTTPQRTAVAVAMSQANLYLGDAPGALAVIAGVEGGGNDVLICQAGGLAAALASDRDALGQFRSRTDSLADLRLPNAVRAQLRASGAAVEGRWDDARADYPTAIAEFRELDDRLSASLLSLEFASYLAGRFDDARTAGEEAQTWLSERGAEGVVERYRAGFKGTPAPAATRTGAGTRAVPVDAEQPA
jgi:class 3 adenylate cyclase/tetratricopeptide (TPR) repeat protein